jgi:hypothetical protein
MILFFAAVSVMLHSNVRHLKLDVHSYQIIIAGSEVLFIFMYSTLGKSPAGNADVVIGFFHSYTPWCERDHWEDQDVSGRTILKWILDRMG